MGGIGRPCAGWTVTGTVLRSPGSKTSLFGELMWCGQWCSNFSLPERRGTAAETPEIAGPTRDG